jgi:tetratricopeptide (TPR) repeat protein
MSSDLVIRLCVLGLAILAAVLGWNSIDKDDMGSLFIYIILVGVIGGLAGVKYLIPWIADTIGTVVYSSGEEVKMDDSVKAIAKIAQGDYAGAISEYEKISASKPDDTFPIAEIAKIYADKLGDPEKARIYLQAKIENQNWEPDSVAFLMFRLAEIQQDKRKDLPAAQDVLEQIIANFPNTKHSANAHHKLQEVQQQQFKELAAQRLRNSNPSA